MSASPRRKETYEVTPRQPLHQTEESKPATTTGSQDSENNGSKPRSFPHRNLLWIALALFVALLAVVAWDFIQRQQQMESPVTIAVEPANSTDNSPPSSPSPSPEKKRKVSKYCKTPIYGAQEVYDRLKNHIKSPKEFAICLKLPTGIVDELLETHKEDEALLAIISKWAEDEKKACWDNVVRALGCVKNTGLAVQIAVEFGFASDKEHN